jgi:copper chaperone CopZ
MADVTPATAPVDAHTYKFNVSMSCGGCSGAVDRVLKKLDGSSCPPPLLPPRTPHTPQSRFLQRSLRASGTDDDGMIECAAAVEIEIESGIETDCLVAGVKSHTVSLEDQTATVIAEPTLEYETVLRTIAKTGKKVNSGSADGEERSVDLE